MDLPSSVALSNMTSQCIHQPRYRQHNRLTTQGGAQGQIRFKRITDRRRNMI